MRVIIVFLILSLIPFISYAEDARWERNAPKPVKQVIKANEQKEPDTFSLYELEHEKKMLELLRESPTPLRTPDTILRVLILPHSDVNNVLHNYKYLYVKVEEGKWVIGDYLLKPVEGGKRILSPLESPLTSELPNKEETKNKGEGERENVSD